MSIDAAREALDELPTGVASVLETVPGYWPKNRRPPLATDRALTGRAMEWIGRLPTALRPQITTERYPRVVNVIAEAWDDAAARADMFDHLLNDRRIGRRGFPIEVEREISSHCLYASSLPGPIPATPSRCTVAARPCCSACPMPGPSCRPIWVRAWCRARPASKIPIGTSSACTPSLANLAPA